MAFWASLKSLLEPEVAQPAAPAARRPVQPVKQPTAAQAGTSSMAEAIATTEPAATDLSVADRLRAEFSRVVKLLTDELPQEQRTPDFMTLIGQLAGDPEGRLRRPPIAAQRAMAMCRNEDTPSHA